MNVFVRRRSLPAVMWPRSVSPAGRPPKIRSRRRTDRAGGTVGEKHTLITTCTVLSNKQTGGNRISVGTIFSDGGIHIWCCGIIIIIIISILSFCWVKMNYSVCLSKQKLLKWVILRVCWHIYGGHFRIRIRTLIITRDLGSKSSNFTKQN